MSRFHAVMCFCRVAAVNKAGVGEFAEIPGTAVAKDLLIPPEMEIEASLRQALKVRHKSAFFTLI